MAHQEDVPQLDMPERIQREVQQYLGTPPTDFGVAVQFSSNPLEFWQSHRLRWPLLTRVAERFLNVPGSSAEVERITSTAGRILTAQRSTLKPATAGMLIFLSHNHTYLMQHKSV